MKPKSAKAKGRALQNWIRDLLRQHTGLDEPNDIESRAMGSNGTDIVLSPVAQKAIPFSMECKNVEKLNVWKAIDQNDKNAGNHEPVLVIKKNNHKPHVVVDAEYFFSLFFDK